MYLCASNVDFVSFYDFDNLFWYCLDSVVYFSFDFMGYFDIVTCNKTCFCNYTETIYITYGTMHCSI